MRFSALYSASHGKLLVPRGSRAFPLARAGRLAAIALVAAGALLARWTSNSSAAPPLMPRSSAGDYGRVTGTVEFEGPAPVDTVVHPTADADVCGTSVTDLTVEHRGPRLAHAVVWIAGVTGGKRLPYSRRFDVVTDRCHLVPHVQAVIEGGTLDVRNADATTHRLRFVRAGTDDVLNVVTETEPGSLVPVRAALASSGIVEIHCERHPWIHGWLAVFGHPYYTMTDVDGGFSIDSIPPGRYAIYAWHERFGTHTDSITVPPSGTANITLRFADLGH